MNTEDKLKELKAALESAYINVCDYKRDHYDVYSAARVAYDVALEAADEE